MNPPPNDQSVSVASIREHFRMALDEEARLAHAHRSDSYYTSSRGRNVGEDEQLAVRYAREIDLLPSADEAGDPGRYAARILRDLESLKAKFRISEEDPDGYGIGTLHTISRKISTHIG
jgi:hypothetical protein